MKRIPVIVYALIVILAVAAPAAVWASTPPGTMVQENCLKCHQGFAEMESVLAGNLSGTSLTANTIQLKINNRLELVRVTAQTEIENIPDIESLKDGMALRVHYAPSGAGRVAEKIVVKPKIGVPENQLMELRELVRLVTEGPERGDFALIDSRPTPGYMEGHIPGAISIPFPKMKEMMGQLPQNKETLIIFYCEGYR